MKNIETLVKEHEQEIGIGRVDELRKCYYILSDGTFLGCNFDYGSRCDDHRAIFACCDDIEYGDFTKLHKKYRLIRFMVEVGVCWVLKYQHLTKEQKRVIEEYNLEVVRY